MIQHAALSDIGLKRRHNQDCIRIEPSCQLFLLADGMGGHAAGEVASRLTVDTMGDFILQALGQGETTWPFGYEIHKSFQQNVLATAARLANSRVCQQAEQREGQAGMGSTLVALLLDGSTAHRCHVGDSRLYRLRGGSLEQLTKDHSLVQEQLKLGLIQPTDSRTHSLRNVVTRAIGIREPFEAEVEEFEVRDGDLLLLCCDGLSDYVEEPRILSILMEGRTLEETCQELVDAANEAGGDDNISVVLVQYRD